MLCVKLVIGDVVGNIHCALRIPVAQNDAMTDLGTDRFVGNKDPRKGDEYPQTDGNAHGRCCSDLCDNRPPNECTQE